MGLLQQEDKAAHRVWRVLDDAAPRAFANARRWERKEESVTELLFRLRRRFWQKSIVLARRRKQRFTERRPHRVLVLVRCI